MKLNANVILRIGALIALVLLAWNFSNLVLYLFLAFIFSLIGKPIARKISGIRIFKKNVPHGVSTLLTLLFFMLVFSLVLLFFIPMLVSEAQVIANINYDELSRNLNLLLDNIQDFLYQNRIIDQQATLVGILTEEIKQFANLTVFSTALSGIVSTTGSFLFGLFAVVFLTFFFIKDDIRIEAVAQFLFGEKHAVRVTATAENINNLLSRYFIGLLVEIASMIVLLYMGMTLFGIPGALFFACFGGMLNAIPYLGPLIGAACACLFGAVGCLNVNEYHDIWPTTIKIIGTFVAANLIDNLVLQPMIYSQSIKAHPTEIFLVIIMGGSLAGIPGMFFAIPVYTIIRTTVLGIYRYVSIKDTQLILENERQKTENTSLP